MRHFVACSVIAATALLSGCETLSLTLLGIGGSAAVGQKMNGSPTRTFTAPFERVKLASLWALERMGVQTGSMQKTGNGELILGTAGDREIEVELESITASATRMRVVARRSGFLNYDSSTAVEIILQTEKGLDSDGPTQREVGGPAWIRIKDQGIMRRFFGDLEASSKIRQ
jgi:hypothetical protein